MRILISIFKNIKYRCLEFKWDRVLKKSGFRTWDDYFWRMDTDCNPDAFHTKEMLSRYPYLVRISKERLPVNHRRLVNYVDAEKVTAWCNENCEGKYRLQPAVEADGDLYDPIKLIISPTMYDKNYGFDEAVDYAVDITHIHDYASFVMIAAFMNSEDALLFALEWGE